MHERSRRPKRPHDLNEPTAAIAGGMADDEPTMAVPGTPEKNPHAAALGRLGGKKGGPARAAKLSAARRSEIAREAAKARWRGKQDAQRGEQ